MISSFLPLLVLSLLTTATPTPSQPVVELNEYQAYGFVYHYEENGVQLSSNVYLSLPYVQPPVGALRLERPQALPTDPDRIVNNTELPPGCIQQEEGSSAPTSEDCLFLSVFTPCTPPPKRKPYPVLVWIHGGGFVYGMNRNHGWKQSTRHFNSRGIVVVHIQYRLNFFGFFALGTRKEDTANNALFDQTAALAFVNKNIRKFGGDPSKVTVMGNSAGSVSVHSLSLSPYSRNYFHQTIQSSGSLENPWAHTAKTIQMSKKLSQALGCDQGITQLTKECLKNVTVEQVHDVLKEWGMMRNAIDNVYWTPVQDDDFYDGKSLDQLSEETHVRKTLYGFNKGEGLMFTLGPDSVIPELGRNVDEQANFTKAELIDNLNNFVASEDVAGPNVTEIRRLLLDYYLRDSNASNLPAKFYYTRYTDSLNDAEFAGGQIWEILKKMSLGWQQHIYLWSYIHPSHRPLVGIDITYTPHAYEYIYLMDSRSIFGFNKSDTNSVELMFTKKLVNCFASFIKTGNPSTKQVLWPAVRQKKVKIPYLLVGKKVVAENTHFNGIAKFWKKIYSLGYAEGLSRSI